MSESRSLTVQQLAERWQRRPEWVTQAARQGQIPGAWKLGHFWRFRLLELAAYEEAQQAPNIFELSPGVARRRSKGRRARGS
ncbi:helix-turn-helix domain-containing protein [Arthrobacter zhaoxinii]|uniref:helix-turn-helix domain-containing protein n=1 Tax=Arthrobacter zhaoxinii TaxID=2964616 RepID=UPI00387EBC28